MSNLCFKLLKDFTVLVGKRHTSIPWLMRYMAMPLSALGLLPHHPLPRDAPFFLSVCSVVVHFMCQLGEAMVLRYLINTSFDVTMKEFFRWDKHLKISKPLSKTECPPLCGWASPNQLKALREKTAGPWGRGNYVSRLPLKSSVLLWASSLPAYLTDFGLANPPYSHEPIT